MKETEFAFQRKHVEIMIHVSRSCTPAENSRNDEGMKEVIAWKK